MKNIVQDRQNLIEQASSLRFASIRFAQGLRTGNFRSFFHGQGMEFSGVRDYFIGDDIRNIDWNVTARMHRPFVKVWTEERELEIFLLVDRSLSMQSAFLHRSKLEVAGEIAMLFAFAAEKNSCSIGGALFDSRLSFFMAPSNNKNQILHLVQNIDSMPENKNGGSALDSAVIKTAKTLKNRTMVVAISDFRIGNFEESLSKSALWMKLIFPYRNWGRLIFLIGKPAKKAFSPPHRTHSKINGKPILNKEKNVFPFLAKKSAQSH